MRHPQNIKEKVLVRRSANMSYGTMIVIPARIELALASGDTF